MQCQRSAQVVARWRETYSISVADRRDEVLERQDSTAEMVDNDVIDVAVTGEKKKESTSGGSSDGKPGVLGAPRASGLTGLGPDWGTEGHS